MLLFIYQLGKFPLFSEEDKAIIHPDRVDSLREWAVLGVSGKGK
jgi:hypothetical protein